VVHCRRPGGVRRSPCPRAARGSSWMSRPIVLERGAGWVWIMTWPGRSTSGRSKLRCHKVLARGSAAVGGGVRRSLSVAAGSCGGARVSAIPRGAECAGRGVRKRASSAARVASCGTRPSRRRTRRDSVGRQREVDLSADEGTGRRRVEAAGGEIDETAAPLTVPRRPGTLRWEKWDEVCRIGCARGDRGAGER